MTGDDHPLDLIRALDEPRGLGIGIGIGIGWEYPNACVLTRDTSGREAFRDVIAQQGYASAAHDRQAQKQVVRFVTPPPAEAGGFSLRRVGVATDQPGP